MCADREVLFSRKAGNWLKGLAILMVLLSHLAEWWSWFETTEGTAEIFRLGCTKMGPYGVAVFLLFSGYGLTKSAGDERIGIRFLLRRLTGVYIPYLILVVLIEVLSDGLHTMQDVWDILSGHDFWYMTVLFLFYLAFALLWLIFQNRHIRAVGIVAFAVLLSYRLYVMGEQDFWYLSNFAFALGSLFALYEPQLKRIPAGAVWSITAVFAVAVLYAVYSGLFVEQNWENPESRIFSELAAVFSFTMLTACFAVNWKWYDPVLQFLGKYSLYFYILHTFIFMWVVNHTAYGTGVRFALAIAAIAGISAGLGIGIGAGMKRIDQWIDRKRCEIKSQKAKER